MLPSPAPLAQYSLDLTFYKGPVYQLPRGLKRFDAGNGDYSESHRVGSGFMSLVKSGTERT